MYTFYYSGVDQDQDHWDKLKLSVLNTDLIVDKLIFKDVQLTATNDDQYFVFEDVLYQVQQFVNLFGLFRFSRPPTTLGDALFLA